MGTAGEIDAPSSRRARGNPPPHRRGLCAIAWPGRCVGWASGVGVSTVWWGQSVPRSWHLW